MAADQAHDWLLVFPRRAAAVRLEWWARALGDWPHVWAARREDGHATLVVNARGRTLQVFVIPYPLETYRAALAGMEVPPRIMGLPMWPTPEPAPLIRAPLLSCVGVTKALLGLVAPAVQTPRQLAHHLAAQGGYLQEA